MECWKEANSCDLKQWHAITRVFKNHPNLIEFFFDAKKPRIRRCADELLAYADVFSSGEKLLIKIALDMWSGSGNAKIWELLEVLDVNNFENVIEAIRYLKLNLYDQHQQDW